MGCIAPFDFISDFYFLVFTPLVLLALIGIVGVIRVQLARTSNGDKSRVFSQHIFAALLLSFIVLPSASSKCEIFLSRDRRSPASL